MCKEIPIILASHGPFAQGALECAEMLIGQQENIEVISVLVDSNVDVLREQMANSYQKLNQGRGVLILVDLMGGTPCNLGGELSIKHDDVLLYCGFNIPVLLEVLSNRELSLADIQSVIEESFPHTCFNVSAVLSMQHEQSTEL